MMTSVSCVYSAGVVSREEMERFSREAEVANAQYQSKVEQHSPLDDHAREEDRSLAEAGAMPDGGEVVTPVPPLTDVCSRANPMLSL